jgi:RNA polymerase sigma-70 factor, ECF subfamily
VSATPNPAAAAPHDDDQSPADDPVAREESALVRRVQQGDTEAFDALVRRYMGRAYRVAYRVLQHREDAEDLVQDSFLRALERIDQCAADRRFGPWFFRILVTQGLNARRQRKRREMAELTEELAPSPGGPEQDAERAAEQERLRSALDGLPKQQQLIVQLAELEGFNSQEIAEMLKLAAGTVRWHLHQARIALRAALAGAPPHGEVV